MKPQKLLVIVGMPGSGKSEAAKAARSLRIPSVHMGDVILDEVKRRRLALTKENIASVADWFHSSRARLMIARLRRKIPKAKLVIIDGARDPKQIAELRKHYSVEILAITAPARLRRRRLLGRHRAEDIATIRELKRRDARELGYGLGRLIKNAVYRIPNKGTRSELRSKIRALIIKLGKN